MNPGIRRPPPSVITTGCFWRSGATFKRRLKWTADYSEAFSVGFIKEGGKPKHFGAGFYSSIPLAIVGAVLLYHIFHTM